MRKGQYIKKLKAETDRLITLYERGSLKDIERAARQYVGQFPEQGLGWKVLGLSLQRLGSFAEAADCYHRAIERVPGDPDLYNNLGVVYKETGALARAEVAVRKALRLMPDYATAHNNLGNIVLRLGRVEEAISHYQQALTLEPGLAMAYNNLGNALKRLERYEEALDAYRNSLAIIPDYGEALYNEGAVLFELGRFAEAGVCFRNVVGSSGEGAESISNEAMQNPAFAASLIHMTMLTLPQVVATSEESHQVSGRFSDALEALAGHADRVGWGTIGAGIGLRLPFYLSYRPGNHRTVLSRYGDIAAKARQAFLEDSNGPYEQTLTMRSVEDDRRVRLGIVSGNVRRHSVWFVMLKGLLSHLDRSVFEVILYHTDTFQDHETEGARALVDRYEQAPQDWVSLIRQDAPDILFYPELGMDLIPFELALLRLAPVQAVTWGHPITSGLPEMDLFFSGELLEPPEAEEHYREKLVRLPGTGACSLRLECGQGQSEGFDFLADAKEGETRFLVCQRAMKFDPLYDVLFARIAAAGNAHLWFVRDDKMPWASKLVEDRIRAAFRAEGADPDTQMSWVAWQPWEQFVSFLEQMDIFLDTPAFSGFTTAWQAVHCGLPVVTLEGERLRERLASGLLRRIGVPDTVATSPDEYVTIAVELGKDRERLADLRQRLRSAAVAADGDVAVVRALEQELLAAVAQKGFRYA